MKALLGAILTLFVTIPVAGQSVRVVESLDTLQARARADSNDAAVHYNLAMGFWSKKRYDDAEHSLRQAIAIEPQFADAYLALGIVHNWDADYWKRIRRQGGDTLIAQTNKQWGHYYRQAFLLDPLVDLKMLGATYKIYGENHFSRGLEDLVEGRYDKAFDHFDNQLKHDRDRHPLDSLEGDLWFHGLAAAHLNRYDVAVEDYGFLLDRARKQSESDSSDQIPLELNDYRYMMAVLQQRLGKNDAAMQLYQEVLENDLGNYMAHVQLARMFEAAQQWDRAIAERRRAVETNPDDASLLLDLGITLGRAGQFEPAMESLAQARDLNPRDCRALFWMGTAALQLNQRDHAREAFAQFVAMAPSRYERQITLARQRLTELQ
ncbi:MAG: tetratricopeptide repeat protein [Gemmatimonadota bacterium]